jgi:hypothetical protein
MITETERWYKAYFFIAAVVIILLIAFGWKAEAAPVPCEPGVTADLVVGGNSLIATRTLTYVNTNADSVTSIPLDVIDRPDANTEVKIVGTATITKLGRRIHTVDLTIPTGGSPVYGSLTIGGVATPTPNPTNGAIHLTVTIPAATAAGPGQLVVFDRVNLPQAALATEAYIAKAIWLDERFR